MFSAYKKLFLLLFSPKTLLEAPGAAESNEIQTDTKEVIKPINILKGILEDGKLDGNDLTNIEQLKAQFDAPSEEAQAGLSELKETINSSVLDMLKNGYTISNESDYMALKLLLNSTNKNIVLPASYGEIADTIGKDGETRIFSFKYVEGFNQILVYEKFRQVKYSNNLTTNHGTIDAKTGKFSESSWSQAQNTNFVDWLGNNNEISIDGLDAISDDMKIEELMKRYDNASLIPVKSPDYVSDYVKTQIGDYPSLFKIEDLISELNQENKQRAEANSQYEMKLAAEKKAAEAQKQAEEQAELERIELDAQKELNSLYPQFDAELTKFTEDMAYAQNHIDAILSVVSLEEDEFNELNSDLGQTKEALLDLEENIGLGKNSVETLSSLKALMMDLGTVELQSISDAVENYKELLIEEAEKEKSKIATVEQGEEKSTDIVSEKMPESERKAKVNELIREYRGNEKFQNDPTIKHLFETTIIVSRKTTPDELTVFENALDSKLESERKAKVNELIREYRGNEKFQNDPTIKHLFETTIIVSRKTTPEELVAFEKEMSSFEDMMNEGNNQKIDSSSNTEESFMGSETLTEVGNTVKEWLAELFEGHPDLASFTSEAGDEIIIEYNKLTNTIGIDTAWGDGVTDYNLEIPLDVNELDIVNNEKSAKEYVSSRVDEIKQRYEEKYNEAQNAEPLINTEKLAEAMGNFKEWIAELFRGNPDLATFISEAGHDIVVEYNKESNTIQIDTAWFDGVSDYDLEVSMEPSNLEYVRDEVSAKKFVDTRLAQIEAEYNKKFQSKAIDRILNSEAQVVNYKQVHGLDVELTKNDNGDISLQLVTLFGDRVSDSDVKIPLDKSVLESQDFATLDQGINTLMNRYGEIFQNETIDLVLDKPGASETYEILEDGSQLQIVCDKEGNHYVKMLAPKGSNIEDTELPVEGSILENKDKQALNTIIAKLKENYSK